jgi:phosphoribosylformylglycinamidine cyclo-ligase
MEQVEYDILDKVKARCISASKKTLKFAEQFGFVLAPELGASANVFALNLAPFIKAGAEQLYMTHLPEGLGTADDARPDDLTEPEEKFFWRNIAHKTVSCLTNDAASAGLQTILISLYLPSATPETVFTEQFLNGFLDGFVEACKIVGCVYLSGETPQLKSKILPDKIDIAGGLWALMPEKHLPITGEELSAGDTIVMIESSGPHENGFTPIRKFAETLKEGWRAKLDSGQEFWQACNAPSKLYTPLIQELLRSGIRPTSIENITGHGWQKIMRSKKSLRYVVQDMLPVTEVFQYIQKHSQTSGQEMLSIFNYGVGQVLFFKEQNQAKECVELAAQKGLVAIIAGHVEESIKREVTVIPLGVALSGDGFALAKG